MKLNRQINLATRNHALHWCVLTGWLALVPLAQGSIDVAPLQQLLQQGKTAQVQAEFDKALASDPENPHLLYNRAIAAYAAGRYEDALIDLDLVENSRYRSLANKARFQKGNAEFRLGLNVLEKDTEATVSHWKQSVSLYEELLKQEPENIDAKKNHEQVSKLLFDLLMKLAQENLKRGQEPNQMPEPRIQSLRSAMEQFHEAAQMEPESQAAQQGEQQSRDQLAQALAQEGTKKTMATNMVMPARNEPPVQRPDIGQIQEGVNMLEDANSLKPDDKSIAEQLQQGRQRLADAHTVQAMIYESLEIRIPLPKEKQALLRMAMESLDKALDQVPEHQLAQETKERIEKKLAEVHEQQGDQLAQQSQHALLEQQAQWLSQALDHFQQASELQPEQSQLPAKAQQTQQRLESVLSQLADKLMKSPGPGESLEQQAMRMEGASQALNELQALNPSERTGQLAQQVAEMLQALRQKLGQEGPPQMGQMGQGGMPMFPTQPRGQSESMPIDAPPRMDTPGVKGPYQSPAMNRNLRDY